MTDQTQPQPEVVPTPQAPKEPFYSGIWNVFLSPASFFESQREKPNWWFPTLLIALAFIVWALLIGDIQNETIEAEVRELLDGRPLPEGASFDQQGGLIGSIIGGVIFAFLIPLIAASLSFLVGSFMMGGKATFSATWSIHAWAAYAWMLISIVLLAPLIIATGNYAASLSLAAILPEQRVFSWTNALLSRISVQHIGQLIIAGIGLAITFGFSRNKGIIIAVITLGFMALVGAAFQMMPAMFL